MKDAYLITYDMSDDKLRLKTANKLIYCGLERIQLSVFMGTVKKKNLQFFIAWFQKNILPSLSEEDSLVILPLSVGEIKQMQVMGGKVLDIEYLTDEKHTLII